jgi:hypothetical protein
LFGEGRASFLWLLGAAALAAGLASPAGPARVAAFLPGTQPGSSDTVGSAGVLLCRQCHYSAAAARPVTISSDWAGGMMAHSARDPLFYAALAVANKYAAAAGNNAGEFCIRCHSPTGWLAGRSEDISGRSLRGTDIDGVQCDYCHRAIDPLNPDTSAAPLTFPVPGYGNAMHVMQRSLEPKRGPFDSASAPHATLGDRFQTQSELCGVCHEVSNPFLTDGQERVTLPPHQYAPIERTYSEWLMSAYPALGDSGTCQSCHMQRSPAYICVYTTSPLRPNVGKHDLTGGNTFIPTVLPDFWPGLDTAALADGAARARATLGRASDLRLEVTRDGDSVGARVRVTNRTGHKLPTGYPDGRRIWIALTGWNDAGDTLFRSGAYDADSARLLEDGQLIVYEAVFGLTGAAASTYGLSAGASFHFALNDTIVKDNRIPPRGFTNAGFASRLASPVGAAYADSQYWDDAAYRLPGEVTQVRATLYYQTISREYVEFLERENAGNFYDWNDWGARFKASWERRGKSSPVAMVEVTAAVGDTASSSVGADATGLPERIALRQNFPNPFNPATRISFTIPPGGAGEMVSLAVYDLQGRQVALLAGGRFPPGTYERTWDASDAPSGIYFCRLTRGAASATIKMILVR